MRKTVATAVLTMIGLLAFGSSASAQFWPGYGSTGGYGAWGAYAAGREQAVTRNIHSQSQLAGQRAATQQSAAMQRGIRNTLSTQAQMRTQNIVGQQQSNRNMWFQVQQQQLAQRQSMSAGGGSTGMAVAAARMALKEQKPTTAGAATDIIKWPPVLCEGRFAEQRALVEAPYRRDPKEKVIPTTADYENMIKAVKQMKILLDEMTSAISAQEYLHAEKFLDQLAAESQQRIEKSKS